MSDVLEIIKIDGNEYTVPKIAAELFQRLTDRVSDLKKQCETHVQAITIANKQLAEKKQCSQCLDYEYLLSRLQSGEKIKITGDQQMKFLGQKLKVEYESEVKVGMTGWIQANWGKLCSIQCDCGRLVSYDVLRMTNELKCSICVESNNQTPNLTHH